MPSNKSLLVLLPSLKTSLDGACSILNSPLIATGSIDNPTLASFALTVVPSSIKTNTAKPVPTREATPKIERKINNNLKLFLFII